MSDTTSSPPAQAPQANTAQVSWPTVDCGSPWWNASWWAASAPTGRASHRRRCYDPGRPPKRHAKQRPAPVSTSRLPWRIAISWLRITPTPARSTGWRRGVSTSCAALVGWPGRVWSKWTECPTARHTSSSRPAPIPSCHRYRA